MGKAEDHEANERMIARAHDFLEDDNPHTSREIFYKLVSFGVLRLDDLDYRRLTHQLTRARERGEIPWEWIEDHSREVHGLNGRGDTSARDYIERQIEDLDFDGFEIDRWREQPKRVVVILEKDAAVNTVERICCEYGVLLYVLRGFSSSTYTHEIAEQFQEYADDDKTIHVLYLGDHDPSGVVIERSAKETIERYLDDDTIKIKIEWERLAVLKADGKELKLLKNPTKEKDSRAAGFTEEFGAGCYELEAVDSEIIQQRLEDAIKRQIDKPLWEALDEVEEQQSELAKKYSKKLKKAIDELKLPAELKKKR
jgi:hypothetical protein